MKKSYLVFIFTLTFTLTLICISINSHKIKSARKALFYGLFKFLYKRQNGTKAVPLKRAFNSVLIFYAYFIRGQGIGIAKIILGTI